LLADRADRRLGEVVDLAGEQPRDAARGPVWPNGAIVTIAAVGFCRRSAARSRPLARNSAGRPSTTIRSATAIAAGSQVVLPSLRYSESGVERSASMQQTSAPVSENSRPATAAASPSPNCTTRNPANSEVATRSSPHRQSLCRSIGKSQRGSTHQL
jgi:hypothetical protein